MSASFVNDRLPGRMNTSSSRITRENVAGQICRFLATIQLATEDETRQFRRMLFESILNKPEGYIRPYEEKQILNVRKLFVLSQMTRIRGSLPIVVEAKPKEGRPAGRCYMNALNEFWETRNSPVIVLEADNPGGEYITFLPHAINYDRATGKYYDTDINRRVRQFRWAFIIANPHNSIQWYNLPPETRPQWRDVVGSYDFVMRPDIVIGQLCRETPDNSTETTTEGGIRTMVGVWREFPMEQTNRFITQMMERGMRMEEIANI
jgi:hypothetical protein